MTVNDNGTHAIILTPVHRRDGMMFPSRGHIQRTTLNHHNNTARFICATKSVATTMCAVNRRTTHAASLFREKRDQRLQTTLTGIISHNSLPGPATHEAVLRAHGSRCYIGLCRPLPYVVPRIAISKRQKVSTKRGDDPSIHQEDPK